MTTLRSIFSAYALSALALALAPCATPPDLPHWTDCEDGTFCPPRTECSMDGMACLPLVPCSDSTCPKPSMCGDCVKGRDEECDDGNLNDGDGCDGDCKLESSMPASALVDPCHSPPDPPFGPSL